MSQCDCTAQWQPICSTHPRRHDHDTTTTRRRHDQHEANTGPTPDPNYKREPFATHLGIIEATSQETRKQDYEAAARTAAATNNGNNKSRHNRQNQFITGAAGKVTANQTHSPWDLSPLPPSSKIGRPRALSKRFKLSR